jgi:hypothetical protein
VTNITDAVSFGFHSGGCVSRGAGLDAFVRSRIAMCGDTVRGWWRYTRGRGQETIVDALAEKLDARLREWKPETAAEARDLINEVIQLADHEILDIARSRAAEQDVLDLLDEPPTR